jgi:hypothetical protein
MKAKIAAIAPTASPARSRLGLWCNKFQVGKTPHLWLIWWVMKFKRRQFSTTASAALAAGFFANCGKGKLPELKVYTWAS